MTTQLNETVGEAATRSGASQPEDRLADQPGATMLRGAPLAARRRRQLAIDVARFREQHGFCPTLAVVIIGTDAPARVYLEQIVRGCEAVGVEGRVVDLPEETTADQLAEVLRQLSRDPLVSGVIVQMPLPRTIPLRTVIDALDPAKDIDGVHPTNVGLMVLGFEGFLPAVAQAAVQILTRSGYDLEGLHAVVVGRSNVVGKPAQLLLLREHCTVTVCHRRTREFESEIRRADVVVVAAGSPGLITGSMLKPGALVVDVGINMVEGQIVGDVDFDSAVPVAGAITPVPGGVGPLTNAILLEQLLRAATLQAEARAAAGIPDPRPVAAASTAR